MIDTPGHVDFGGDVTRAMRAVDGAVVVVDAVEGTMPQTETVLRQALKEGVRPVLFINKVDRLINELKVDEQEMQIRLARVIDKVNRLIKGMNEKMYDAGWKLDAAKGTVAFGSALYNWAVSVPYMKKSGVSFKDVYEKCNTGDMKWLAKSSPLHAVLLDMVVKHLPNPLQAQERRIHIIWHGDYANPEGKAMLNCDPNGPVCMMVTDITFDPHAGEVATGRLFSGTLRRGTECYIMGAAKRSNRLAQVGIFMGAERIEVDELAAGNIAAVTGLKDAIVGSTVTTLVDMVPFESLKHYSEPVMTVAVEAKNMKDLPKLVEVLRQVAKEDPTVQVSINEETGEHLISGMGELHLEIITGRIKRDKGVDIITSPPIVVYRETITGGAGPVEGKSPNRHNRFYLELEPMDPEVVKLIQQGDVSMTQQAVERRDALVAAGTKDLHIIVIASDWENRGIGKLVVNHQIKSAQVSHTGTNKEIQNQMNSGEISVELVPQGTLMERCRAFGMGLGGILTPTGIGTVVEEGKQIINLDGEDYILETAIPSDFALIRAWKADRRGNLIYSNKNR